MKGGAGRFLAILLIVVLAASCGVGRKAAVAPAPIDLMAGYPAGLLPYFHFTEGNRLMSVDQDRGAALAQYDKAIALDSTLDAAWYERAAVLMGYRDSLAEIASRRAVALDSTNVWYWGQLGRILIAQQKYPAAVDIFRKLIEIAPREADNYRLLAALYETTGMPFTAIAVLDSAETKLGRIAELTLFRRQLLVKVRMYDPAIAQSLDLIEAYPFDPENYVILGELYAQTGKDSLARANLQKAVSLAPDDGEVIMSLAEFYRTKGDQSSFLSTLKLYFESPEVSFDDKSEMFEQVTENRDYYGQYYLQINMLAQTLMLEYPGDFKALDLYARHLLASGMTEDALKLYKGALTDTTTNLGLLDVIVNIETYLEHPDSAARYNDMALRLAPKNYELWLRRGMALNYMKQDVEAVRAYEQAYKYAGTDSLRSVIRGVIGDEYHKNQQAEKSYRAYEKALKLWPDNAMVLNNYSYYLSTTGQHLDKALEMAKRAVELVPSNPSFLDTYAWAYFKLGDPAQAKKLIQQAISLDRSGSAELFIHYGDVLMALGDKFMAAIYWRKALEKGYDKEEIEKRLKSVENK